MRRKSPHEGFTLTELLLAIAVFSTVSIGLFTVASTSLRLVARNLATNHSHEVMRLSNQQLLHNLHEAASPFRLVDFDGTNYTDSTPAASADQDPFTQQSISTRSNGVRYRRLAGGPYRLTSSTVSGTTVLSFDFGVAGALPYVPEAGDKVSFPLLAREFDISAINIAPSAWSTTGTITISDSNGIGYTIDAVTAGNVTTGWFYREVAFTAYNNQLRYHPNFNGSTKGTCTVVRDRITSPKPFALLFATGAVASDGLNLRVSLETYDTPYSAQMFANGTATLQDVIPSRTQPGPISSTNAN